MQENKDSSLTERSRKKKKKEMSVILPRAALSSSSPLQMDFPHVTHEQEQGVLEVRLSNDL